MVSLCQESCHVGTKDVNGEAKDGHEEADELGGEEVMLCIEGGDENAREALESIYEGVCKGVKFFKKGQAGELVGIEEEGVYENGERGEEVAAAEEALDEEDESRDEDGGGVESDKAVKQSERWMVARALRALEKDIADRIGDICDENRGKRGEGKCICGEEKHTEQDGLQAEEGDEGGRLAKDDALEQDGCKWFGKLPDEGGGGADCAV